MLDAGRAEVSVPGTAIPNAVPIAEVAAASFQGAFGGSSGACRFRRGPVTASMRLDRKRPELIPLLNSRIEANLGATYEKLWEAI